MRDRIARAGLGPQVSVGVAILMTVAFGIFGLLALRMTQEGEWEARVEREKLAAATAKAADTWIQHEVEELARVGTQTSLTEPDLSEERLASVMEETRALLGSYSAMSLHRRDASVVYSDPQLLPEKPLTEELVALTVRTVDSMAPVVGMMYPRTADRAAEIIVAVPVPRPGAASLALVGRLELFKEDDWFLLSGEAGSAIRTAIIDANGELLAGDMEPYELPYHLDLIRPYFATHQVGVAVDESDPNRRHFVSYAPLSTIPAGVIRERGEGEVSSAPSGAAMTLLIVGAASLAVATLGAWTHARWVTQPLRRLEIATRQLARGDLTQPLESGRGDEIGRLTESFEEMRRQLARANEERDQWEAVLEKRVAARTGEVRELLGKVIAAQEEERGRLARELHDETAQTLATTLVAIQAVRNSMGDAGEEQQKLIDNVLRQGRETLGDVRRMVMDLRPSVLENVGLVEALTSWAEQRLGVSGTSLRVTVKGEVRPLGQATEIALFRIFQEAMNNVVRHAGARSAALRLTFGEDGFTGEVEDDGGGFDRQAAAANSPTRGVGFHSMMERAELLGATLDIESEPGKGTTVRVRLPSEPTSQEERVDGRNPAVAG